MLRAAASNRSGPLSRSLTTTSSPGSTPASSHSVINPQQDEHRFAVAGDKSAPATQPWAYYDWPNLGIIHRPGEVTRDRRRVEEEEVDASLAHPVGEIRVRSV